MDGKFKDWKEVLRTELIVHELFNLTYGENNIYDVRPETSPAFAEGWFLFVKPLPQGDHTIKIHSKISNPTDVSCDYKGDTEWNLKIK